MSNLANAGVEHKQTPILDNGEIVFTVDEKIQSLIQFLWDNDIETFNSCQDNVKGTVWIQYYLDDWMLISECAFRTERQELYWFIQEECNVELLFTDDGEPDENDEDWIEGENLLWSASVRFDKAYLPKFEQLIRAALQNS